MSEEKVRTILQNKSLHKWLEMVADCLNQNELDHKAIYAVREVSVPWCKDTVKAELFRPILKALSDRDSTADADTTHYAECEKILAKHIAENFGVTLPPWPDRFSEADRQGQQEQAA